MRPPANVVAAHPANAGLRRHFERRGRRAGLAAVAFPEDVADPYYGLGTHPDLVARLWDELGKPLPADCRVIFFGAPALVHPASGVVFGFAEGTHAYGFRLPERERLEALAGGGERLHRYPGGEPPFDLDEVGDEWIFCNWSLAEPGWCRAAFDHAGGRSSARP